MNKYHSDKLIGDDIVSSTKHRILRAGNKLSSRHAQKGIVGVLSGRSNSRGVTSRKDG